MFEKQDISLRQPFQLKFSLQYNISAQNRLAWFSKL